MPIRITGMNSGLDTESIITELVKAKSTKKDSLVKAQTKLQWKQDAWKELNSKVYSLYSKTLSNMRLESDYVKKTTKVSNSTAATVITGSDAVNGVQTLKIDQLAKTGYLTGGKLEKDVNGKSVSSSTKLTDLGVEEGSEIQLTVDGKTTAITIDADMTITSFVKKLQSAGVNASFDAKNQRFFISSKKTGAAADFSLTAKTEEGLSALNKLGLATSLDDDIATRRAYLAYCNATEVTDANGKVTGYTYSAKAVDENAVNAEAERRLAEYISNQKELKTISGKITDSETSYEEKYKEAYNAKNTKELEDDLAAKKEQLKKDVSLNAAENADKKEALEKEIETLEARISDSKDLDELKAKEAELNAAIQAENGNFKEDGTAEGGYTFDGDILKNAIRADMEEEAAFAADVLNGNVSVSVSSGATRIAGQDAKITLNGADFESTTNTFEINGLTITANAETDEEFTITTSDDVDGIYDMVKNFLKEYNELINEMDKLYNADSSKGYEPLTDEEKEAMSEKEIEKWEEKIKDSILRKDSTLNSVASAMKSIMLQGVTMKDGAQMYLSDFGINTLGYFNSADNEKNAYHIDGDPDDTNTSGNGDKLKTAIANNSDQVVEFFTKLSKSLYGKLGDMMKKTEYSSSFTLYDDIAMKEEYNDYTSKISDQEEKITDFEDRYYKKFSAMETALAKLSSKESAISGLLGM